MFQYHLQRNSFLRVLVAAVLLGNTVYGGIFSEEKSLKKRIIRRETINDFSYYGDEGSPAKSCADIFKKNPKLPSGVYWLEFLRIGSNKTFKEKHYCINEEQENPNKIILVPKPAVEQKSPMQLLKGTSNSNTIKPSKEKVGSKPSAVHNLTAGDPDSEPEDDEYLNEQQQWPLAITPPTKEEMRKRLEKAAQRIQDNNGNNIVQNTKNKISDASDRQSMIQMGYSTSERKQNNSLIQNANENYQLNNVVSESVSRENLLQELSNDKGREDLVKQGGTNVSQSQSNSSYSNVIASSQNASLPLQPSVSSSSKPVQERVKMTLLSLKKNSAGVTNKNSLVTKMAQSPTTETDADKRLTKKEQEREGLFVKPGLNRGVIETLVTKNATKINKDEDINNGNVRDLVSTTDSKSQKPVQLPYNERIHQEKPKYAIFNDKFGANLPVLIGGELSIEGNPIGDPIKKPNPDELHSGLWTSEVQRMLSKLKADASKHKEHANNRGKEIFFEFVEKNKDKLGKNENHPAPPKDHLSESHSPSNYKPAANDLLFFVAPEMTKGPHSSINNDSDGNHNIDTSRGNITAEAPSNLRPEFQSSQASQAKTGGQISKSFKSPIVVILNGFEKMNETSLQPIVKSLSNNETYQRSNSQVYAQAHANATSFSQTESHSHALSQTSQQQQPKKNKTKSQLAMEKTKAALAERIKQFNADLKADTESNYFHWAKQPPEKTPMQLRLEKITERLKGKQNSGLASHGTEMIDDVGTDDVNSMDWSKFDEKYIPSMVEINKRLNAIPYAEYAAKKKSS